MLRYHAIRFFSLEVLNSKCGIVVSTSPAVCDFFDVLVDDIRWKISSVLGMPVFDCFSAALPRLLQVFSNL